jgi:hypothetical protein
MAVQAMLCHRRSRNMSAGDDFEQALQALARIKGTTVEALKQQMLEREMGVGSTAGPAPTRRTEGRAIERIESGDASGASLSRVRAEAIQRHQSQEFPGSPVVRYAGDHRNETPEEAKERWYEEEADLLDGVHGLGGSTAGGIFGEGPISTNIYDPSAMGRADGRMSQTATVKLLGVIERLEQRLTASEQRSAGALPPGPGHRRLPRGGR